MKDRNAKWKLLISLPLLALLVALDGVPALEGIPLLLLMLGVALLLSDFARVRLKASGRANLAMVPFMACALVLLVAFCKGRNLSQGALLAVTLAVVFDILLMALAVIAEAGKRRARGVAEFVGLTAAGALAGLVLSIAFLLVRGGSGTASLANP